MKSLIRSIIFLFIVALLMTQGHSLLREFYPDIAVTKFCPFWDLSYHREISIQWFLFFIGLYFFLVWVFFACAMACMRFSFRLTLTFTFGFLYWLIKMILLCWNYDSSPGTDWALVSVVILCIVLIVLPLKQGPRYKSMI